MLLAAPPLCIYNVQHPVNMKILRKFLFIFFHTAAINKLIEKLTRKSFAN
jgi:hypothetical protein